MRKLWCPAKLLEASSRFLDKGFLFALVSKRDAHHLRVVEVFRTSKDLRLVDYLLTTNHVDAETITLTRKKTTSSDIGIKRTAPSPV
jgi:predicted nucleic acid-binding protein